MLNTVVTISIDLLAHPLAERFLPLFEVASRKSLRPWRVTPGVQADVLVLDAAHANALGVAQARCVISVGEQARLPVDSAAWVSWLPQQFTVADLIGTLDRAAIFLHEQRSRKSHARAAVVAQVGGRTTPTASPPGRCCRRRLIPPGACAAWPCCPRVLSAWINCAGTASWSRRWPSSCSSNWRAVVC